MNTTIYDFPNESDCFHTQSSKNEESIDMLHCWQQKCEGSVC